MCYDRATPYEGAKHCHGRFRFIYLFLFCTIVHYIAHTHFVPCLLNILPQCSVYTPFPRSFVCVRKKIISSEHQSLRAEAKPPSPPHRRISSTSFLHHHHATLTSNPAYTIFRQTPNTHASTTLTDSRTSIKMAEPSPTPQTTDPEPTLVNGAVPPNADVEMADSSAQPEVHISPPSLRTPTHIPHTAPHRPSTSTSTSSTSTHTRRRTAGPSPALARPNTSTHLAPRCPSIIAQLAAPQRARAASADAADSARQPDARVLESACDAAFAGGDEASGDDGAG